MHAASRDWQLAGLVGKTLWNYSECVAAGADGGLNASFGGEDIAAELVELLAEMLDAPEFANEGGDPGGGKRCAATVSTCLTTPSGGVGPSWPLLAPAAPGLEVAARASPYCCTLRSSCVVCAGCRH